MVFLPLFCLKALHEAQAASEAAKQAEMKAETALQQAQAAEQLAQGMEAKVDAVQQQAQAAEEAARVVEARVEAAEQLARSAHEATGVGAAKVEDGEKKAEAGTSSDQVTELQGKLEEQVRLTLVYCPRVHLYSHSGRSTPYEKAGRKKEMRLEARVQETLREALRLASDSWLGNSMGLLMAGYHLCISYK